MTDAWDLSCPDWWQRLQHGRPLVPDLPLFEDEAARGVRAFDLLRLADVPGMPRLGPQQPGDAEQGIEGDACGDWFRAIVRALFGSYNRADGCRMIREVFALVPKKNSKTSYGALVMLTALLLNQRPRAPFMLTAPVQDTADMAFAQCEGAIEADPVLKKKLHVRPHLKTIVHRETKAELEILTFDPAVVTGKKPVGCMIDELHVIGKMAKAASAMRQIRGGMLPFPEAFLLTITTQSEEQPTGVFADDLAVARAVRDGKSKAPILPVLYEFPENMQASEEKPAPWRDPSNWHLVTPNLGRSVQLQSLVQLCEEAEDKSEAEFRAWASQHLNIQIGVALHAAAWTGAAFWKQQALADGLTLEQLIERCDVATIGLDGGGLEDLYGLCVLGRDRETGAWLAWFRAFAHPVLIERRKSEASKFAGFEEDGDLVVVKRVRDDIEEIARICVQVRDAGLLDRSDEKQRGVIGVDRAGIDDTLDALFAEGFEAEQIVPIQQGWPLMGAIQTTERRLAGAELWHGGTRLMNYVIGNCKTEPKGNAITVTKAVSGRGKIDPAMAMFNAVRLMSLVPEQELSVYDLIARERARKAAETRA